MQSPCQGATGGSRLRVTGALAPVGPPLEPPLSFYMYLMQELQQSNLQIPPGQSPPNYGYNTVTEVI